MTLNRSGLFQWVKICLALPLWRADHEPAAKHWNWPLIRSRCRVEALRIVRAPQDADEVVQEAMTRAWRRRHSCRTPEAPLPWCLQITRNEAIRLIGQRRRLPSTEPIEIGADITDERSNHEIERRLDQLSLGPILSQLTPHERLLVSLRYERDWSHPEIARTLRIPEATARVRLYRVHNRIRTLLGDAGFMTESGHAGSRPS